MGNYIVSARKYRPMGFDEVVGQDHITTTLKNAIQQDQLAQALLFCGPRGVGKTTCARIVANMINGFDPTGDGSSTALNIHELDAASNNSVDDIRNLIDQVRYPPQYGKYKVYIIDEVHMLSTSAFNAFLKTLEEPPSYAIFILATTEKHKVIPTILSRCQIFDFNRININDIANRLALIAEKENIKAEPEALHLIAQKSDGALRDALSLFDLVITYSSDETLSYKTTAENLHILDYDYYFKVTDFSLKEDLSSTLLTFNDILKKGFDGQNFISGLAEHFRNLLVCQNKETIELLEVSENVKKKYLEQSNQAGKSFLLSGLNILNQCDLNYKNSRNPRLHVELTLMKLVHLNSIFSLQNVSSTEGIKKKDNKSIESTDKEEEIPEKKTKPVLRERTASSPISRKEKKILKIPTLHEIKEKSGNNGVQNVAEELEQDNQDGIKNPFSVEQLKAVWEQYQHQLKKAGKKNEFNLLSKKYNLEEDYTIRLQIDNSLEEDILERFRINFTRFLREKLDNYSINLVTELKKDNSDRKIYTNKDKFNHLAEKNPFLHELKNKFGLDTEF